MPLPDEKPNDKTADALIKGWDWLIANPSHPDHADFYDRWLNKLNAYEESFAHTKKPSVTLPEPSPWVEELREQLVLGGTADVDAKQEDKWQKESKSAEKKAKQSAKPKTRKGKTNDVASHSKHQ